MHDQPIYSGVWWSDGQSPQSDVAQAVKTMKNSCLAGLAT
jgi:hypothetical protein